MVTVFCSGLSGWDLEGQDRRISNPRDGRPVGSDPVAASEEEHPRAIHHGSVYSRPVVPQNPVTLTRDNLLARCNGQRAHSADTVRPC